MWVGFFVKHLLIMGMKGVTMKKLLSIILALGAFSLLGDDLLRNAPWRFVSASGGAGNVEKAAGNGRKIS